MSVEISQNAVFSLKLAKFQLICVCVYCLNKHKEKLVV